MEHGWYSRGTRASNHNLLSTKIVENFLQECRLYCWKAVWFENLKKKKTYELIMFSNNNLLK
jgi:hypothetical protein